VDRDRVGGLKNAQDAGARLANRGVWEAILGAGPVCSIPATDEDVDAYLAGWDSLLDALAA
jgi:hypothetical protein